MKKKKNCGINFPVSVDKEMIPIIVRRKKKRSLKRDFSYFITRDSRKTRIFFTRNWRRVKYSGMHLIMWKSWGSEIWNDKLFDATVSDHTLSWSLIFFLLQEGNFSCQGNFLIAARKNLLDDIFLQKERNILLFLESFLNSMYNSSNVLPKSSSENKVRRLYLLCELF